MSTSQVATRQVAARGISWSLTDAGPAAGPVLFLLHGNRDGKEMWQTLTDQLPDFRVIAVDLPGHGGTTLPPGESMADHVTALSDLFTVLELPSATVVGHSLGGQLAIGLAAARPSLVGRLVVMDSALRHTSSFKPPAAASNEDMISHVTPFFFPAVAAASPRREDARRQVLASWAAMSWNHHQQLGALTRLNVPAAAILVKAPTLLIYGDQDRVCPFDPHGAELRDTIGDCQTIIIDNAGHFTYLEYPELVAAAIRDFTTAPAK
jgi:pimeloyl-ACP methyl ester carboxylesterase